MSASQDDLRNRLAMLERLEVLEAEELAESPAEDTGTGFADKAKNFINEADRQAGLTIRGLAGGAAQIAEPFTEPVRYLLNKVLPEKYAVGNIEEATDKALTAVGVPEPQGAVEEGVQTAGRFVTGFSAGFKADDAVMGLLGLSKKIKQGATTMAEVKGIATAAYKTADDAGVVINPNSFKSFVDDLALEIDDFGLGEGIHSNAIAALKSLQKAASAGEPLKLKKVETLRQIVGDAFQGASRADAIRVGMIKDGLDAYTNKLGTSDILSGNPKVAMAALKTAREAWHRSSNSRTIEEAVKKAVINSDMAVNGGKFERALITQFKQIARNPSRFRGFSADEQKAIEGVIRGGKIQNIMKTLGNLAPSTERVLTPGNVSVSAATGVGGPAAGIAVAATGVGSRRIANKITTTRINELQELVRSGSAVPKDVEWLVPWLSGAIIGADTQ